MGTYNIVNPAALVAGQPEDISVLLANLQAIQSVLNGGVDNSNIAAAAAIVASKIAGYPSDATKYLRGDGTWGIVPPPVATGRSAQVEVHSDLLALPQLVVELVSPSVMLARLSHYFTPQLVALVHSSSSPTQATSSSPSTNVSSSSMMV